MRTLACLFLLLFAGLAQAQAQTQDWQVRPLVGASPSLFAERCQRAPAGLPDGCMAQGSGDISAAWYTAPTDRYRHAILGDALEAGALTVRLATGAQTTLTLPTSLVFEDRTPRLADLDGDGRTEIITLRSSTRSGGSVAVYGVRGEAIVELGATPFIGRANRWLNIAGIADFSGRGDLQVAFVETPHIGGTLKLATFDGSAMAVVTRASGYSNHEIRSPEQRLSALADVNGDGVVDLAVPDARRMALNLVSFASGRIETLASVPLPAAVKSAIISEGSGRDLRFVMGLANGLTISVEQGR